MTLEALQPRLRQLKLSGIWAMPSPPARKKRAPAASTRWSSCCCCCMDELARREADAGRPPHPRRPLRGGLRPAATSTSPTTRSCPRPSCGSWPAGASSRSTRRSSSVGPPARARPSRRRPSASPPAASGARSSSPRRSCWPFGWRPRRRQPRPAPAPLPSPWCRHPRRLRPARVHPAPDRGPLRFGEPPLSPGGADPDRTNRQPQDLYALFASPVLAEGLLDRLLNSAYVLPMLWVQLPPPAAPRRAVAGRATGRPATRIGLWTAQGDHSRRDSS